MSPPPLGLIQLHPTVLTCKVMDQSIPLCSYFRWETTYGQKLGDSPGVGKCPMWGSTKFGNAPPLELTSYAKLMHNLVMKICLAMK